jgi:DNA polymerase-2
LNDPAGDEPQGLIPRTLEPLIKKRVQLKKRKLAVDKARILAQKNLLIVSFGYAGYVNARFGKIEIHETITSESREGILLAKESAEALGFEVLHIYVDGIWIKKEGANQPADFQPVLDEIEKRTGLPIVLDGIFKWVVFLPSRARSDVPVPNRYFGVFQDGSIKNEGHRGQAARHPAVDF